MNKNRTHTHTQLHLLTHRGNRREYRQLCNLCNRWCDVTCEACMIHVLHRLLKCRKWGKQLCTLRRKKGFICCCKSIFRSERDRRWESTREKTGNGVSRSWKCVALVCLCRVGERGSLCAMSCSTAGFRGRWGCCCCCCCCCCCWSCGVDVCQPCIIQIRHSEHSNSGAIAYCSNTRRDLACALQKSKRLGIQDLICCLVCARIAWGKFDEI